MQTLRKGEEMKTMRDKFEKLPEIKDILHTVIFNDQFNNYHDAMINSSPSVYFIRGAWYAFQEQQKKIDAIAQLVNLRKSEGNYYDDYIVDKIEELLNESQPK